MQHFDYALICHDFTYFHRNKLVVSLELMSLNFIG